LLKAHRCIAGDSGVTRPRACSKPPCGPGHVEGNGERGLASGSSQHGSRSRASAGSKLVASVRRGPSGPR
jgi:hypothetical protein